MTRQLASIVLAILLELSGSPLFAQVRVAPVEVAPAAIASAPASVVPVSIGGAAFQRQVAALASVHAARLGTLMATPQAAIEYLQARRLALPADPQAAAAQLASLALVSRAIAAPAASAGAVASAAPTPTLARRLAALNQAVQAQGPASGSVKPLVEAAREILAQTEPALRVARLFDGFASERSEGARAAQGGWSAPIAARLAAEDESQAEAQAGDEVKESAIDRLPESVRKKVMQLKSKKDAALEATKKAARKGMDLQAWGLPNAVSVDQKEALRYARLYRMNGMPTDLGLALHEVLSPLVEADPGLLRRLTAWQLHQAAQILSDSLAYRMQPDSDDMQMQARLIAGAKFNEGFDYPEQRKQLMREARDVLLGPPAPGDKPMGLKEVPVEQRPSVVMTTVLQETVEKFGELQEKVKKGEAKEEDLGPLLELVLALHAAMGLPIQVGPGQMAMITVKHEQLRPVVAELSRREVSEKAIGAVVRSFPLGESLWRLGIPKLWAKGLTGKGIKVGVIDNGVDFDHPDLQGSGTIFENMTYDRGDHTKGGHGTAMASIIHAIAPDAQIQSYQAWSNAELPGVVMNEEESLNATLKAMDRAKANGANIISISGGFTMGYGSDAVSKKVTELAKAGIVVIVSAGNEGDELPAGAQVRSPASSPDAIAVGAVNYHGKQAEFSSGGRVFTRGAQSTLQKPEIYAYGVMIKGAAQLPPHIYEAEPAPYGYGSGTSPAAPHVSGVAALMLQAARQAVPDVMGPLIVQAVKAALVASAKVIDRLPVLRNAQRAIDAFLAAIKPAV